MRLFATPLEKILTKMAELSNDIVYTPSVPRASAPSSLRVSIAAGMKGLASAGASDNRRYSSMINPNNIVSGIERKYSIHTLWSMAAENDLEVNDELSKGNLNTLIHLCRY